MLEYFSLLDLSNIPAAGDFPNEVLAAYLTTPSPDIPASDTPSTYRAHSSTRRSPGRPTAIFAVLVTPGVIGASIITLPRPTQQTVFPTPKLRAHATFD